MISMCLIVAMSQLVTRATRRSQHPLIAPILKQSGQPKVGNLHMVQVVEEQILWLDVPVNDSLRVQILNAPDQLTKVLVRQLILHAKVGLDPIEQLAARRILEDYVELVQLLKGREVPFLLEKFAPQ